MSRTSKPEKKPIEQYDRKGKERCVSLPFEAGRNRQKTVTISRFGISQVQQ